MQPTRLSAADLDGFRAAQRLAYRCAETIAAEMQPGMTERQVASRMKDFLLSEGADDCFHQPFAWFGDRTAFRGFLGFRHLGGFNPAFYPGNRRLEENMPFILDCAPTRNGYTADIGYCGVIGENKALDKLMDDLMEYRFLIVELVRQRKTLAQVSQAVDRLCAKHGYEPRHKAYPFEVLAHRVEKLEDDASRVISRSRASACATSPNCSRIASRDRARAGRRCGTARAVRITRPRRAYGRWNRTWVSAAWARSGRSCWSSPRTTRSGSTTRSRK